LIRTQATTNSPAGTGCRRLFSCSSSLPPMSQTSQQPSPTTAMSAPNCFASAPNQPAHTVPTLSQPTPQTVLPIAPTTLGLGTVIQNFNLFYPTPQDIFFQIRNGLSTACRQYQITYRLEEKGGLKSPHTYVRWLFWRDEQKPGGWGPELLPKDAKGVPPSPGFLGTYEGREFWTASPACLADFIVIALNSTAGSHATALASPKGGSGM